MFLLISALNAPGVCVCACVLGESFKVEKLNNKQQHMHICILIGGVWLIRGTRDSKNVASTRPDTRAHAHTRTNADAHTTQIGTGQKILHVITVPWKVLFAVVPPPSFGGGYLCFVTSLGVLLRLYGFLDLLD